jgi:hypothetical protein
MTSNFTSVADVFRTFVGAAMLLLQTLLVALKQLVAGYIDKDAIAAYLSRVYATALELAASARAWLIASRRAQKSD